MGRLNSVVWGVCGLGVGILLGLAIASIAGGSLPEVMAERDRLREQLATAETDLNALQRRIEKLDELQKHLESTAEQHIKVTEYWFKSQAVLGMILYRPPLRSFFFTEEFGNFRADWYMPEMAVKLFGGRWLVEEMVDQDLLDKSVLVDTTQPDSIEWKTVKKWTVRGTKATEGFRINSAVWRIAWDAKDHVSITVHALGGTFVTTMGGQGADSSFVRASPGEYYLRIDSFGMSGPAKVRVEEPE